MAEEEVCGCVEVRISSDYWHHCQVPYQGWEVNYQEKRKEQM